MWSITLHGNNGNRVEIDTLYVRCVSKQKSVSTELTIYQALC